MIVANKPWRRKAERLIGNAARESYERTNRKPDGTLYRKHRPYTLPAWVDELVGYLNTDNEHDAKVLFARIAILGDHA